MDNNQQRIGESGIGDQGAEYAELIAKLEKATEPSRELDCLIGVAIGRFEARAGYGANRIDYVEVRPDGSTVSPGHGGDQLVPRYTGSFDAALMLVPEGFEPHTLAFPHGEHRTFGFEIFPPKDHPAWGLGSIIGRGFTAATTISAAALRARAAFSKAETR